MHQTIIGVAAPANAPNLGAATPPQPRPIPHAPAAPKEQSPAPPGRTAVRAVGAPAARTIIGGMDPCLQLAAEPTPAERALPNEPKWKVLIAKQGTVEMATSEIVRAFVEGRVTHDTNIWRGGLDDWKPLREVEALHDAFRRAGLPLPAQTPGGAKAPVASEEKPNIPDGPVPRGFAPEPPTTPQTLPVHSSAPTPEAAKHEATDEGTTRIAPSPWQVPDVGAQAAARLASSAGLPPRQNTTPPSRPGDGIDKDHTPLDRPSRRPDIGPRATVRGQLAAISNSPAPPEESPEPLPFDAQPNAPPSPAAERDGLVSSTPSSGPRPHDDLPNIAAETSPASSRGLVDSSEAVVGGAPRVSPRHKGWWFSVALVLLVPVVGTISYRTKQPKAVYAYLHRQGWDASIARSITRSVQFTQQATHNCVVQPYRSAIQKLHSRPPK